MTPEKRAKIKELRAKLANLTPEQQEIIRKTGMVGTVEGRTLSFKNAALVGFQYPNASIVGGYQQWKRAGRQVKKGEHGMMIWIPCGPRDDDGELIEAERFLTATVFDIAQTEPIEVTENLAAIPAPAISENLAEVLPW
jgi:hypothetical protein